MGKKLKAKIHVRDNIVDFLTRTAKFLASSQAADEHQIRFRLEKLEAKWDEFEEVQADIEETEDHEESIETHREVRENFEEMYFEVRAGLVGKYHKIRKRIRHKGFLHPCLIWSRLTFILTYDFLKSIFPNSMEVLKNGCLSTTHSRP